MSPRPCCASAASESLPPGPESPPPPGVLEVPLRKLRPRGVASPGTPLSEAVALTVRAASHPRNPSRSPRDDLDPQGAGSLPRHQSQRDILRPAPVPRGREGESRRTGGGPQREEPPAGLTGISPKRIRSCHCQRAQCPVTASDSCLPLGPRIPHSGHVRPRAAPRKPAPAGGTGAAPSPQQTAVLPPRLPADCRATPPTPLDVSCPQHATPLTLCH